MKKYLTLALALSLSPSLSWGQQVYNPTATDPVTQNTAGGTGALPTLAPEGRENTGFGYNALASNYTGVGNVAFGNGALYSNAGGWQNTATGAYALYANTDGSRNTVSGVGALYSNTIGGRNVAMGLESLLWNTIGSDNIAIGTNALTSNTTGNSNTATGNWALYYNSSGIRNTAMGLTSLHFNTTGFANTAIGVESLLSNTTGSRNTALGTLALVSLASGTNNIAIGWAAGNALTSGNNNIYLANPGVANENNTQRLGNTQTRTFIAGVKGVPISGAQVTINNAGQVGILASSQRFKTDIETMNGQSRDIYKLRPVTYRYKTEAEGTVQYGLIAEEVAKVYPELAVKDSEGQIESLNYTALIPMLLNELQKQRKQIEALEARLDRQSH